MYRESGGRRFFFHLSTNDVVVWNSNTTDGGGGAGVVLLYRAPPKWTRSWRNISKRREKSRIHLYSGCAPSKKEEEAAAFISLADRGDINTSRQKRRVGDGEKEFPPLSLYLLCVYLRAIT